MTREQYRMKDIRLNIFFFILFNNISDNIFFNNDLPLFQKKKNGMERSIITTRSIIETKGLKRRIKFEDA